MAKTLRTANIRVTGVNKTEKGIVRYSKKSIIKSVSDWSVSKKLKYFLIEHYTNDKNDIERESHFHIVIKFQSPTNFSDIKKRYPYGKIEPTRSISKSVQYLTHLNDKSKRQYKKEDIVTNDRELLDKYFNQVDDGLNRNIEQIIEDIGLGKIREYNQWEKIPMDIWVKNKARIENAHIFFKEKMYMDKNRQILGIFVSGKTGTGKTTFAKDICRKAHKSFCVSSASNDPFQDYKGEDVLILDDLRDKTFSLDDLLKTLDLHTKSTIKSRYHNKFFLGDWIIITSTQPLEDWYMYKTAEDKQQLKRRLKEHYQITDEIIKHFRYNPYYKHYEFIDETDNYIKTMKREELEDQNFFDALGLESRKVESLELSGK